MERDRDGRKGSRALSRSHDAQRVAGQGTFHPRLRNSLRAVGWRAPSRNRRARHPTTRKYNQGLRRRGEERSHQSEPVECSPLHDSSKTGEGPSCMQRPEGLVGLPNTCKSLGRMSCTVQQGPVPTSTAVNGLTSAGEFPRRAQPRTSARRATKPPNSDAPSRPQQGAGYSPRRPQRKCPVPSYTYTYT